MADTIDYAAVLADLEGKRAALDSAIAAVRQLLNLEVEQGTGSVQGKAEQGSSQVHSDSFFGMSTPDAIRKYLGMAKRPQSLSEITKALQEGNLPTTSSNLMGIVGPTLSRMKAAGDVISVQGKWGLSEWYPAARRERLEAVSRATARKTKKKRKAKAQASGSLKPTAEQIEKMKALHQAGKSYGEIGKELGISTLAVYRALGGKPKASKTDAA